MRWVTISVWFNSAKSALNNNSEGKMWTHTPKIELMHQSCNQYEQLLSCLYKIYTALIFECESVFLRPGRIRLQRFGESCWTALIFQCYSTSIDRQFIDCVFCLIYRLMRICDFDFWMNMNIKLSWRKQLIDTVLIYVNSVVIERPCDNRECRFSYIRLLCYTFYHIGQYFCFLLPNHSCFLALFTHNRWM